MVQGYLAAHEDVWQGLKPNRHLGAFAAWLKPCPCYKTVGSPSFSASSKSCP